jgi:hypothetical protein
VLFPEAAEQARVEPKAAALCEERVGVSTIPLPRG